VSSPASAGPGARIRSPLAVASSAEREQAERATQAAFYWSSTENDNNNAWNVNFFNGNANNDNKNNEFHVRAVRAGS